MFRVIIFDVEHGFCAFVKSPTGCTLMIDCGKSQSFSPVDYVLNNELNGTVSHLGHRLTKLIVTHPHDDHIEDVASVISKLPPYLLQRQQYDWEDVKQAEAGGGDYENLDMYSTWQERYNAIVPQPNWGIQIQTFSLTPYEARQLNESKYVNNSGIVTVVTFNGTEFRRKIVFGADVEQAAWIELLRKPGFRDAVRNPDFYVPSHHGHTSGFSTGLYNAMGGKPFLNLVSVTEGDEHVDSRYSSPDFATGVVFGTETRYMLTTRADGSIFLDFDATGRCVVKNISLEPNLVTLAQWWR